jgi:hypothetical protein
MFINKKIKQRNLKDYNPNISNESIFSIVGYITVSKANSLTDNEIRLNLKNSGGWKDEEIDIAFDQYIKSIKNKEMKKDENKGGSKFGRFVSKNVKELLLGIITAGFVSSIFAMFNGVSPLDGFTGFFTFLFFAIICTGGFSAIVIIPVGILLGRLTLWFIRNLIGAKKDSNKKGVGDSLKEYISEKDRNAIADYIVSSRKIGLNDAFIREHLKIGGWTDDYIDIGFKSVSQDK